MNVIDIMTQNPITIRTDNILRRVLNMMMENQIKHLPVLGSTGHLIGVISDRDCRRALNSPYIPDARWQNEHLAMKVQVRQMMTPAPIVIEPTAAVSKAADMMLKHRIGCLPVMREETLVGIVTRSDILVAYQTLENQLLLLDD